MCFKMLILLRFRGQPEKMYLLKLRFCIFSRYIRFQNLTHTPGGYILFANIDTPRGYIQTEAGTMAEKKCPHCQKKNRSEEEIKDMITRLNRIEGQIRGIRKMIEEDAYCVDILTQVSAARCSLNSFSKVILGNHIKTCVADDIRNGSDEKTEELVELLQKLMK